MPSSKAWLLQVSAQFQLAVAELEMVEYVIQVKAHPVATAPYYCKHVMYWRNRFIPLLDCHAVVYQAPAPFTGKVGVVAYQTAPKTPLRYVGLQLYDSPATIKVEDKQACAISEALAHFNPAIHRACFSHNKIITPILDIQAICSVQLARYLLQRSELVTIS